MEKNKNDITELGQVSSHESYRWCHVGENPACCRKKPPWQLGVALQIGSHDLRHNENRPVSSYFGRFGRIYYRVLYSIL